MSDKFRLQEKERRAARRAPIVVRVECKTPRTFAQGNAENISATGMLIACRETFDVSQTVTIRFALQVTPQNNVVVSTKAVVVRMEPGRFIAIQFLELPQGQRAAIVEYIAGTGRSARAGSVAVPNEK